MMIKLLLITGFLGAGKTTLLRSLLELYGARAGVIVNDFGALDVDAALLRPTAGRLARLENGSVFCACLKTDFVKSLVEMSAEDIDMLFIEASGLADPASMEKLLRDVAPKLKTGYDYMGSVCVVDAVDFIPLAELLPALCSQAEYASAFVINKADIAGECAVAKVEAALRTYNNRAPVFVTSFCALDIPALFALLSPAAIPARESLNTFESRPACFTLKCAGKCRVFDVRAFLENTAPHTYRIKGFVPTEEGVFEVECVRDSVSVTPYSGALPATGFGLTLISSEGIKLLSRIAAGLSGALKGRLIL